MVPIVQSGWAGHPAMLMVVMPRKLGTLMNPIGLVPEPLANYRVHPTSLSGVDDPLIKLQGYLAVIEKTVVREPLRRQPKTIDVTIEYLRPGRAQTTYARADVRKVGRRIANVHVEAWQDQRASPVAALRGHFLLSLPDDA